MTNEQIAFRLGSVEHDPFYGKPGAFEHITHSDGSATFYVPAKAERQAMSLGATYVVVSPSNIDYARACEPDHRPGF